MDWIKTYGIPIVITYVLIGIVAVIKLPLSTLFSPALTPTTQEKYTHVLSPAQRASVTYGLVTEVSDGDTLTIDDRDRVRFLGIDTPELAHPESNIRLECYAEAAKARLTQLVLGKYVYLVSEERDRDKYNRLLRYVFVPVDPSDDSDHAPLIFVNAYLLGEGYARSYILEKKFSYKELFATLETEARTDKEGLWGSCDREKFRW